MPNTFPLPDEPPRRPALPRRRTPAWVWLVVIVVVALSVWLVVTMSGNGPRLPTFSSPDPFEKP